MTAPAGLSHVQAVLDMLGAALAPIAVYFAEVPGTPTMPYVVVYPDPGTTSAPAADGQVTDIVLAIQITAVGSDATEASGVADAVRDALDGQRPVIDGRVCEQIAQTLARPIQRDDIARPATNRPTFYAVAEYSLSSVPT